MSENAGHGLRNLEVARTLQVALETRHLSLLREVLAEDVRWGGPDDGAGTCHGREQVEQRLAGLAQEGLTALVVEEAEAIGPDAVVLALRVSRGMGDGWTHQNVRYWRLRFTGGRIVDIRGHATRDEAIGDAAGRTGASRQGLTVRDVVPILRVSNIVESTRWFSRLGWRAKWQWCDPTGQPTFASLVSGRCELFLSTDRQGPPPDPASPAADSVWVAVWVDDLDAVYEICRADHLEVLRPPRTEPWGAREMHVRHPDGHVLRISSQSHSH